MSPPQENKRKDPSISTPAKIPGHGRLSDPVILIDCRYLGPGGAGRVTELLLRGLVKLAPAGRFVLWGPEEVRSYLWPSAAWVRSSHSPTAAAGQRELFRVPSHDLAIYLHQIRPLRPDRAITTIYDTIPLRYGGSKATRFSKGLYLRTSARLSARIVTLTRYSASCIERDLGVPKDKITVIRYPIDHELRARVEALRREHSPENVLLFVGRFASHKNLGRLIAAFPKTRAAADGSRLILVGGTTSEFDEVAALIGPGRTDIELRPPCSQTELERLYATSRLLVMPSLEEGYGLPAWEAATCGLKVCLSDIPALREILPDAPRFDPTDVGAMGATLDEALNAPPPSPLKAPDTQDFATEFLNRTVMLM